MIANREELVAELESLFNAASSGELAPEDLTRFQSVVDCAREYVPEFEASDSMESDGEEMEDGESEEEAPPTTPSLDIDALISKAPKPSGTAMFSGVGAMPEKKPSTLPPYSRRKGV